MASPIRSSIPCERLERLEFLLGESAGLETLYPPGGQPVKFDATVCGSRETCDRFVRVEFFAEIPRIGTETFSAMLTYSEAKGCYRMWIFAASSEEPLHMTGNFDGGRLVFVSDPTSMLWGTQRLRYTFTPNPRGSYELLGELWELEGYVPYCSVFFHPTEDEEPQPR